MRVEKAFPCCRGVDLGASQLIFERHLQELENTIIYTVAAIVRERCSFGSDWKSRRSIENDPTVENIDQGHC